MEKEFRFQTFKVIFNVMLNRDWLDFKFRLNSSKKFKFISLNLKVLTISFWFFIKWGLTNPLKLCKIDSQNGST